jgi:hypothetical protein
MRKYVLGANSPPRFQLKLNKDFGTTENVFWALEQNEQTGVISPRDLAGYSAECQLKTLDPNTCEFSVNAELLMDELIIETGDVSLKTDPVQTINDCFGVRLNLTAVITKAFLWDKAVGTLSLIRPDLVREPLVIIEFDATPDCGCS